MFDRKEYDRLRARKLYEEFKIRKEKLVKEVFGNCCFLCDKVGKGLHLHHVYYGEESNYPRHSKSFNVRLKRLKEAETYPDRFKLLCPKCHFLIEAIKKIPLDKIVKCI